MRDLLSLLGATLAQADPDEGLRSALQLLSERGVVPNEAGDTVLGVQDQLPCLQGLDQLPDAEAVRALLRLALARTADQQVHRRARERMDMLSAASFEGILIHAGGEVIDVNQRLCEMVGYTAEELLGANVIERCVAPEDRHIAIERLSQRYEGEYLITAMRKDGTRFRAELLSKQGKLGDRPVRVSAVRDVTERERTQAQLREIQGQVERNQRLESLGVLAGGVAHDFNNLLVGVLGNAELLLESAQSHNERQAVQAIHAAGERAAALTAQLLAYAGQRDLGRREPVDLARVWQELRELLEAALSKKANWVFTIEPNSVVLADRSTIAQVLMNLLTNASDALADRVGAIEVRTRRLQTPDARWTRALGTPVTPGDWVLVEVRDTGAGMTPATMERIFEPFYTTKHKGQGLGLATCLGIVTAHGGAILVESEFGKGSVFSVLLPGSELPTAETRRSSPPPRALAARRVLVVDDEAIVRSLLRRSLERRGYLVREASDGHAALTALEQEPADVLVLDMTMPDIDGAEVVRRIRATGSSVPIVLSSGYMDAALERQLDPALFQGFLLKPYTIAELTSALDRALSQTA